MNLKRKILTTSSISLFLSSLLTTSAFATDVTLDLTQPKDGESAATGNPLSFTYAFDKDGKSKEAEKAVVELKQNTNYFWAKDSGSTLSLKTQNTDVATAIFSAPGNNDNLTLSTFNYISVGANSTTKGRDDTYFAILNGPVPYVSFTLNGANIFSGSNLFVGAIGGTDSKTGGFANVYLKGNIKVDANAIDQSDSEGSGQKNATLNFYSEYNNATYTIDSGATLDLTSTTSTNSSQVIFNLGETKDGSKATGQSVKNQGTINVTNLNANINPGSLCVGNGDFACIVGAGEEKNSIIFNIDLNNEGTINLQNSTLHFNSSNLSISESGSVGSINIKALATTKQQALDMGALNNKNKDIGNSQIAKITNNSTIFFKDTNAAANNSNATFNIKSQSITISGIKANDGNDTDALLGSSLTIGVGQNAAATGLSMASSPTTKTILLTGSSDKQTTITLGDSASDDRNTRLAFVGTGTNATINKILGESKATIKLDNFASINIAGGAKLDLKDNNIATNRTYGPANQATSKTQQNSLLDFFNQGSITITGVDKYYTTTNDAGILKNGTILYLKDGKSDYFAADVNPNVSFDATNKKVVLTDYATTTTTGKKITDSKNDCTDLINCTLETKETSKAGSFTFSGGYHQILADTVYNFGNLYLKDNATLDLTKITNTQDGATPVNIVNGTNSIIGFVNAGSFTSTGGVIELRKVQESSSDDIDGMNANNIAPTTTSTTAVTSPVPVVTPNTYKLVITENKKEKVNDSTAGSLNITSMNKNSTTEGQLWAANKNNETRAEFIVDSGSTIIRAQSLINKGLTTIQNSGTLDLTCVGTDYCYNGRYWTKATTTNGKEYVTAPNLSTSEITKSENDNLKFEPTQIVFDNSKDNSNSKDNEGILRLSGGILSSVDSYRYQDKDNNYADVTGYIYHSLKIDSGTLEASGNTSSRIIVGLNDTENSTTTASLQENGTDSKKYSALTLNNTNLSIKGDSNLFIFTQKDEKTTNTKADVTWIVGSQTAQKATNTNTFTMSFDDDTYSKNTRGFYILGAEKDSTYNGGIFNIDTKTNQASSGVSSLDTSTSTTTNGFEFVIDLSNLSAKNTILLDKQYNFIVAKEIQKDGTKLTDTDITMKINFGKSVDSSGNSKDYGKYDADLCKTDAKFCLDASDTSSKDSSSSPSGKTSTDDTITINGSNKEGVLVVDKSDESKVPDITDDTWLDGNKTAYADFVTFNKIYNEGSGSCNFNTLEGCAVVGFNAVKSKTLSEDGVIAVFQSIKDRASQLPNTENSILQNVAKGINHIETTNNNSSAILQSIINTNGALSSSILLQLQKMQYTGDLATANQVATTLDTINNSLDSLAHITRQHTDLTARINFTSTLSTNARLAQVSNPYNTRFAKVIKSLEGKKLADNGNLYSYTDRFDYDNNSWAMLIGGVGGQYSNGFGTLGGFSAGYDKIFDRTLLGGYATYAYSYSMLDKFNDDASAKSTNTSHNVELGSYLRTYINAHEIDVVLSETLAFSNFELDKSNPVSQRVSYGSFTTNLNARYGYVMPISPEKGFYIKPYGGINLYYQYNTNQKGRGELAFHGNSRHSGGMTLSAFVELRKYSDDKKYFYFTPGLEQDVFNLSTDSQIYIANNINQNIFYKVGNQIRTYLTLMGGGEVELKNNLFFNFGIGAKISWDRYFLNTNIGIKYKFNSN